jgi:putative peptidoglycan lipid II flippase
MLLKKLKKTIKGLKEKSNWKLLLFHSSWSLTLTSGLSYGFGFLRDKLMGTTYGLSNTLDIYNAAFVIPDILLSVIIGTTMSAAFLPIFTKRFDEKRSLGFTYAHQIMSWGFLAVLLLAVSIGLTLPYFAHKMVPGFDAAATEQYILFTRILLLSPLLFTLSNIYGRMLLSFKEFLWYGLSPALYNIGIVIGVVFIAPQVGEIGLILGVLLGVLLHLSNRLINIRRNKINFRHKLNLRLSPEIKETLTLTAPKVIQYLMWGFLLASFTGIASELGEGSITTYNYARNFQSIPVSLLGIAIALSMYPALAHDAGRGNFKKFRIDFNHGRLRSLVYTTLGAICLAIVSRPLASFLLTDGFGNHTEDILLLSNVLKVYCVAVPLESMMHAYHRAYYSLKNTIIPATLHALIILGTIVLAKNLATHIGVYAIPTSFGSGLLIQVIILAVVFPAVFRKKQISQLAIQ